MATLTLFGEPVKFVVENQEGLIAALAPKSAAADDLPVVSTSKTNAISKYKDERFSNQTNISIYATGNGAKADTGLKKSNQTLSHACDSDTYVSKTVYQIGALGGKIVKAIRDAIKAILAFLGINPSSAAITSKIKKIAQWIKDQLKFVKEIQEFINGYVIYINAIKELIAYILSLPAQLLAFFSDCLSLLRKQLAQGFASALVGTEDITLVDDVKAVIKEVENTIDAAKEVIATVAQTAATVVASVTTLNQVPTGDTEAQTAASKEVFAAAGFSQNSNAFGRA
jgi:hypothetical protein